MAEKTSNATVVTSIYSNGSPSAVVNFAGIRAAHVTDGVLLLTRAGSPASDVVFAAGHWLEFYLDDAYVSHERIH